MPRGGRRQGTQGKAYANRTDLAVDYGSQGNPAAGGMQPVAQQAPFIGADQVPNIGDPTAFPNEPVTTGLMGGPGDGPDAMPPMPPSPTDPVRQILQALILSNPNPDLVRALARLDFEGR